MISRTILLLYVLFVLPPAHTYRPDTVPDTELRPLFPDDDTSTQVPTPSIHYPMELPLVPYSSEYIVPADHEDYHEYEDDMFTVHYQTELFLTDMYPATQVPVATDGGTIVVYTVPDELDAQQEKLANSAIKNCVRWKLIIALAALMLFLHSC